MRTHDSLGRFKTQARAEGNPIWKGSNATVNSVHCWVRDNFSPATNCEICQRPNDGAMIFDWSNKDHEYTRNRNDWQHVCRSCHNHFDFANGLRKPVAFKKGRWSMKYDKCIRCQRSNVKYKSRGMCSNCYRIEYDKKA